MSEGGGHSLLGSTTGQLPSVSPISPKLVSETESCVNEVKGVMYCIENIDKCLWKTT